MVASRRIPPLRQSRLLSAAAKEFSRGFQVASLNEILREAGFSKSSFYHYFADKQELFNLVASAAIADCIRTIEIPEPASLTTDTFWPAVENLVDSFAENSGPATSLQWLAAAAFRPGTPSGVVGDLEASFREWTMNMLTRGRELDLVSTGASIEFQAELIRNIVLLALRWSRKNDADAEWEAIKPLLRV